MALEANIIEFPFTTGQNEGTERAVLPMGQFSYLQNARFRKNQRLGKRNGYTAKTSVDASGTPLGNGGGRLSCLGPNFCAVDDRFYQRDQTHDAWSQPPFQVSGGALYGGRLAWRWPQFMPAPVFSPSSDRSPLFLYGDGSVNGTLLQSTGSFTSAQRLVFSCWCYWHYGQRAWVAQIAGTDPETGKETFWQELPLSGARTDPQQPTLLSTGDGTLVLVTDHFTAGAKDQIDIYRLTSLAAGFGAVAVSIACLRSAVNYYVGSQTEILITYATASTDTRVGAWSAGTGAFTIGPTVSATGGVSPTLLSVFGTSGGNTWISYTDGASLVVRAFTSALILSGSNSAWNVAYTGETGPICFTPRDGSATVVTGVFSVATGMGCADFSTAGAVTGGTMQFNLMRPISQPFNAGGLAYCWVRHYADTQLGVATLVRLPPASDFTVSVAGTQSPPIEATLDDEDIDLPVTAGVSGPTFPTPLLTDLGYVALLTPTTESIVTTGPATYAVRKPLMVPVRHRSEGLRWSSSHVLSVASKSFVSSAQPLFVDAVGVAEAGFVQGPPAPVLLGAFVAGNLTPSTKYQYTGYYEAVDSNGLVERSAPCEPLVKLLGALENEIHLTFAPLELTKKTVRLRVFRTIAGGSQFFNLINVDASPVVNLNGTITIFDTAADSVVEQNGKLYTQIGQELPASQFPACSFAAAGSGRLLCAGGFHANVGHFSKLFVPRLSPEFADDDAFRVTLPDPWTGAAYCDAWVAFTQSGIYIINGDGPDGAGVGFFTFSRLPFSIGCIDWRSVVATELGVFFQSARGLYLLPRGFGAPVAMDQVLDTLTTYPIITSARSDYNSQGGADNSEQIVQWTAVADEAATSGVTITFDLAYKAFYVDTCGADYPATFASGWSGDAVQAPALTTQGPGGASKWHPFRVRDDSFDDEGLSVDMRGVTGDVRPWGTFAHGVVNRAGLLAELRAACELEVRLTTDRGESHWKSRIYTALAPDWLTGDVVYLEAPLGMPEQRDVVSLRVSFHEDSTSEGAALFGLYIEHQKENQGWRLLAPRDRVNVLANALITESGANVITTEDDEQIVTEG